MIDHGCLTMVQPWSTMVIDHGPTMVVDHGSAMFIPQGFECLDIMYLIMIDHGHVIFECGTNNGQTMVACFNLAMVNHGSTMVKT